MLSSGAWSDIRYSSKGVEVDWPRSVRLINHVTGAHYAAATAPASE